MDLLQNYKGDSSSDDETSSIQMEEINSEPRGIIMPLVNIAPHVVVSHPVQQAAVIDPKTKELYYNPKYEELFMPDVRRFFEKFFRGFFSFLRGFLFCFHALFHFYNFQLI